MRGFSLIELLAVIVILAILLLIAVPMVSDVLNSMNQKLYDVELTKIIESTKSWTADNILIMPTTTGEYITITLDQLKLGGYIKHDIQNPVTKKPFPNDMEIVIKRTANEYSYMIKSDTGSDLGEFSSDIPFVIIKGYKSMKVPMGLDYVDPGIFVRDEDGFVITNYTTTVKVLGEEVPSVDTSVLTTYTVHYLISANGTTSEVIRTIEVIE